MAQQDYVTVSGVKVHRSDFAYAPDGSQPSEWKLPIHDAAHVRNALARFNQTHLPAEAKAAALAKIHAAAKNFGIEVGQVPLSGPAAREKPREAEKPQDRRAGLALPCSDVRSGLVRIAVAYTGDFESQGKKFSISAQDLEDIRRNLSRREAPIDYEHLSAAQGPPGWARAAGWLRKPAGIEDFVAAMSSSPVGTPALQRPPGTPAPQQGRKILWAWAEFTPVALAMIKQREYRYFSPEIHWKEKDETGETIGTRLAAGAVTNRPFLKDLPPIEISDADYQGLFGLAARDDGRLAAVRLSEKAEHLVSLEQIHVQGALPDISVAYPPGQRAGDPKEKPMKSFKLKKLTEGEHQGKIGVFEGDELVGVAEPCEPEDDSSQGSSLQETALLARSFPEGRVDRARAVALCEEGRLGPRAIFRAQEAEAAVEALIRQGKVLPRRRGEAFRLALERPQEFTALLSEARSAVDLRTYGHGARLAAGSQMLTERVRLYAQEHRVPLSVALTEFTRTDEGRRLWEEHSREFVSAIETGAGEEEE